MENLKDDTLSREGSDNKPMHDPSQAGRTREKCLDEIPRSRDESSNARLLKELESLKIENKSLKIENKILVECIRVLHQMSTNQKEADAPAASSCQEDVKQLKDELLARDEEIQRLKSALGRKTKKRKLVHHELEDLIGTSISIISFASYP